MKRKKPFPEAQGSPLLMSLARAGPHVRGLASLQQPEWDRSNGLKPLWVPPELGPTFLSHMTGTGP